MYQLKKQTTIQPPVVYTGNRTRQAPTASKYPPIFCGSTPFIAVKRIYLLHKILNIWYYLPMCCIKPSLSADLLPQAADKYGTALIPSSVRRF
jgi:hypothetical protein